MKRMFTFMLALSAGFVICQSSAMAEMIQGRIVEVKPEQNSVTVSRTDPSGKMERLRISTNDNTQGIESLAVLKVGDEVMIDASQNILTRQWTARSVQGSASVRAVANEGSALLQARTAGSASPSVPAASRPAGVSGSADFGVGGSATRGGSASE